MGMVFVYRERFFIEFRAFFTLKPPFPAIAGVVVPIPSHSGIKCAMRITLRAKAWSRATALT
jgi:hypothetical protein